MLVFWDQRLAFLATPKTGSTAIAAALESLATVSVQRPPVLKHTTVHRYRRFVGPYLKAASKEDFTVVALMREPRDWLGSWYRYRQREDTDPERSTRKISFEEFVRAWCLDRLFRYEDIDGFVAFLEDRLGCEIILPRLNVSPVGMTLLTAETAALLREVASEDYALYATLSE
jgi:hypothetical protein